MWNHPTKNASIAPARSLTFSAASLAFMILIALAGTTLHAQFVYVDVYDFGSMGCLPGCVPIDLGQLTRWSDGNYYGSTFQGTGNGLGTLFRFNPSSNAVNLEWQFTDDATGFEPYAALSLGSDGNFYGTTEQTITATTSVFKYTPPSTLTVIHNYTPAEGSAVTAPTQGRDGNFYGVVGQSTYRITNPGGVYEALPGTIVHSGSYSPTPLVAALDGNLYATQWTYPNNGTIFRLTTAGKVKVVHTFDGAHGSVPTGLTLAPDGNLYGTTLDGGANGTGVIFKFTLPGRTLTVLHSFSSLNGSGQNSDGAEPSNGLLAASDGYLYGATSLGGNNTCGTLFRISTSGSFTKLAEFPNDSFNCLDDGSFTPIATLTENTDGTLYGLTEFGDGGGNLYALVPSIPFYNIIFAGPIWVKPGVPVQIFGDNLGEAVSVAFGGVAGTFQPGSNTYLTAVASDNAVDGPIVVTLTNPAGGQEQVQSQQNMHILPVVRNLDPARGAPGSQVGIAGGGFLGATKVTFGGIKALSFTVTTPSLIQVTVPTGAKTGKIVVTTPNGTATSTQKFVVD
jgi:uncharacterized repeat protein (TIGR03803 family)